MKRSRINPVSKKRRQRSGKPGKLGIVRLFGEDMKRLRRAVFVRSGGRCEMDRDGRRCEYPITWSNFELAHIRNRRMYGDTLENTLASCKQRSDGEPGCHVLSHNAGGRPCFTEDLVSAVADALQALSLPAPKGN